MFFWQKKFHKLFIFVFSFYPTNSKAVSRKTSITQEWLVVLRCPNPSLGIVINHLSIGLQYTLSFEWSDSGLKFLVTVVQKRQPPNFKTSIWNFPISKTGSKCSPLLRLVDCNWVITKNCPFLKQEVNAFHF